MMKYSSLRTVNLTVIDGRNYNVLVRTFFTGALLALANRFDGHILVVASSNQDSDQFELFGEEAGVGFFFHGEVAHKSSEFLELSAGASRIFMLSPWPTQAEEMASLRMSGKELILSSEVARLSGVNLEPDVRIIKIINPMQAMSLIQAGRPKA
jgi:hypothetical protein